jgi:hypothetical protein
MAEGFRASDEDWEKFRRYAADRFLGGPHRCVLELADRLAALEQVQQQAAEPKFCVGQIWRQKCGNLVRIKEIELDSDFPIETYDKSGAFFSYTLKGKWLLGSLPLGRNPRDLIELVDEAAPASAEQQASAQPAPPAPAGGLVERLTNLLGHYGDGTARAVIREVAEWLDRRGHHACSLLLRLEADR